VLNDQSLAPLAALQDYGVLCAEHVRDTIATAKNSQLQHPNHLLRELDAVLEQLKAAMQALQLKNKPSGRTQGGWLVKKLSSGVLLTGSVCLGSSSGSRTGFAVRSLRRTAWRPVDVQPSRWVRASSRSRRGGRAGIRDGDLADDDGIAPLYSSSRTR
jgi:hypothetical protein